MLPNDANILFSYINTKLRDEYPSLEEFCLSNMCDRDAVCAKLSAAGYIYDAQANKFICKRDS